MRARGHGNRYERRHGRADRKRACARRVANQQCAVAGFVVLEPWAETPWRAVRACSIERQATVSFHDHQGCTLAAPTFMFIGNCRPQCRAAKVS